ncbi:conserved hypothetical protein [Theileria orientalis strain Shintoku]|uniref:Uncharacterized protein n=1 Tax=Theileria orientalis strain Shintoku TaxID=869250 RepID=J4D830_THEOR|nr:conserved hypothetical protein [Theileria orientalis strain Shintoku]BAM40530.1 conserved hypothetical protein [Theileria orientalis strain Shintoku]|eukprot:XP_009690831.1 conserved hypothetical protein [Theileria orientalis strain Shintoku]
MTKKPPGAQDTTCKLIASFIALSSHLIMHQIDVTSVHFSVAFDIPINNISIYFSKLFSFRCMLIAAGTASELVVSQFSKSVDPRGNQRIRKWFSMGSFIGVFFIRMLCLFFLSRSSQLGYYVYVILSIEAYFFGYFHASVVGLVPEHSLAVALAANVSRFFILSVQLILDALFYSRPLLMIKLQVWIGVIMTGVAVAMWIYFNYGLCAISPETSDDSSSGSVVRVVKERGFGETLCKALSPFSMFFGGSIFKDFLFPGVLPYALLLRDRCHFINMLVPVSNMVGPVFLFCLEYYDGFPRWTPVFNTFWLFVIPMIMIFVSSFLAMHSRISFFRRMINSRNYIIHLTLTLVCCNGFLDPLSFGGVAKIVKTGFDQYSDRIRGDNPPDIEEGSNSILTLHILSALFMRFVFSKLSVGYNDTRVSLGYALPKFRPIHRMSKFNAGWYIFRQTFIRAWKDAGSDFKMDIKQYL